MSEIFGELFEKRNRLQNVCRHNQVCEVHSWTELFDDLKQQRLSFSKLIGLNYEKEKKRREKKKKEKEKKKEKIM